MANMETKLNEFDLGLVIRLCSDHFDAGIFLHILKKKEDRLFASNGGYRRKRRRLLDIKGG